MQEKFLTYPVNILINKTKIENLKEVEYDQEKQTKYYELIRWSVNQLASEYHNSGYNSLYLYTYIFFIIDQPKLILT